MARRRWKLEDIKKVIDGTSPFVQIGYTQKYKHRKIGDIWTDSNGKTWKKTESGIVSVNRQMDEIRDLVRPKCSVCNLDIFLFGDKVDRKIFAKTGKCFQCLEVEETTLKVTGKYKDYENAKLLKNKLSLLKEFRQNVIESIKFLKNDNSKIEMVCSNGKIVTWTGSQNKSILKDAEDDLIKVNDEIKKTEELISKLEVK
jgi:hypothetical protein